MRNTGHLASPVQLSWHGVGSREGKEVGGSEWEDQGKDWGCLEMYCDRQGQLAAAKSLPISYIHCPALTTHPQIIGTDPNRALGGLSEGKRTKVPLL